MTLRILVQVTGSRELLFTEMGKTGKGQIRARYAINGKFRSSA